MAAVAQDLDGALIRVFSAAVAYRQKPGIFTKRTWVLRDLDFEVRRGETLGVVGRNGAGKTTLLQLLAGILAPERGRVVSQEGMKTCLLSLQVGFNLNLSGRDNVILGGLLLGMNVKKIKARMDAILEYSDIGEAIDRPLSTYSTGMRARLGFALALQVDPELLLIDEMLGVGDNDFRKKSSETIRNIIKSDHTVVLTSHNSQTIKSLCDRVIWMDEGRIKAIGPTSEVMPLFDLAK